MLPIHAVTELSGKQPRIDYILFLTARTPAIVITQMHAPQHAPESQVVTFITHIVLTQKIHATYILEHMLYDYRFL